ncbi:MAG: rod shape-determining protein MreC [bacterium]
MTQYRPFRKKTSYVLPAMILVLAALLSFVFINNLSSLRMIAAGAIYPFQFTANAIWHGTTGFPGFLIDLKNQAAENAALKAELASKEISLLQLEELKQENARLREGLGFSVLNSYHLKLIPSRVVGRSASPQSLVLIIDKGSKAGVLLNRPVVVRDGLVGLVIEVSPLSSKVLLITDPSSSVAAVEQNNRSSGVVEGYSPYLLSMKYVNTGAVLAPGDKIVTAAASLLFPPGIPIGIISSATKREVDLFYDIKIKPAVNFFRLEEVFVVASF